MREAVNSNQFELYVNSLADNQLKKDYSVPDWLAANKERAYYYYQWNDEKKHKTNTVPVNFYLNTFTGVWKILY